MIFALIGYLAMPIDLVPDFIPVAGQLDDVLIAALTLRIAVRSGGPELLREHWPGPESSLAIVSRLAYGRAPPSPRVGKEKPIEQGASARILLEQGKHLAQEGWIIAALPSQEVLPLGCVELRCRVEELLHPAPPCLVYEGLRSSRANQALAARQSRRIVASDTWRS